MEKQELMPRKKYVKPEVTRVELVAEEAILGGCKTGAGAPFNPCDGLGGSCGGTGDGS